MTAGLILMFLLPAMAVGNKAKRPIAIAADTFLFVCLLQTFSHCWATKAQLIFALLLLLWENWVKKFQHHFVVVIYYPVLKKSFAKRESPVCLIITCSSMKNENNGKVSFPGLSCCWPYLVLVPKRILQEKPSHRLLPTLVFNGKEWHFLWGNQTFLMVPRKNVLDTTRKFSPSGSFSVSSRRVNWSNNHNRRRPSCTPSLAVCRH